MATTTEQGRARQRALFDFLGAYPLATTDQLASLIWGGNQHLARVNLLGYVRAGLLHRMPHPLYRNGCYVYTRTDRSTTHGQKVLHHLVEVDFHIAVVRHLGRYGARIVPEVPWAPGVIPDQTVLWKDAVWAVEHHLSGQFSHAPDYQRFMDEEAYTLCHWWRKGVKVGLLVIASPTATERIRAALRAHELPGLLWRVTTAETALRDPGPLLRTAQADGWARLAK